MREVVAQAERPVMLYSIGKDSSVMLRLALKAFYPGKPPFPFLHIDTTWKFREMYAVPGADGRRARTRDARARQSGGARATGINPFEHGSAAYTDVMKTESLKQALDKYGFDAAFGGARRDEERSRAKERVFSFRSSAASLGPQEPAAGAVAALQRAQAPR